MAIKMHSEAVGFLRMRPAYSEWRGKLPSRFDVFRRLRDGTWLWVVAADGLEEAKIRINRLAGAGPEDYMIYSKEKGLIVERVTKEQHSN